jgi:hypothetical protein
MDDNIQFTEEVLKAQHGKKVPLKAFPGGPIIGEATLKYDPGSQSLNAEMQVDDPMMAKILGNNPSSVILRQGKFKQGE